MWCRESVVSKRGRQSSTEGQAGHQQEQKWQSVTDMESASTGKQELSGATSNNGWVSGGGRPVRKAAAAIIPPSRRRRPHTCSTRALTVLSLQPISNKPAAAAVAAAATAAAATAAAAGADDGGSSSSSSTDEARHSSQCAPVHHAQAVAVCPPHHLHGHVRPLLAAPHCLLLLCLHKQCRRQAIR